LRNVSNIPILEQQLIHCRNRIVSIMRQLSEKPKRFFDWLIRQSPDGYSPHVSEKLKRLQQIRKSIPDHEYEWVLEQVIRLSREIWQVKLGSLTPDDEQYYGHNALWQLNPEHKAGKIITDLRVTQCDGRIIMLELPPERDVTDFRSGDIVILYDLSRPLDKQEIIRGVIESMDEKQINLRIRAGVRNDRRFGDAPKWALEHDTLETFLYAPFSSLSSFLEAESAKRDLLLGIKEPTFTDAPSAGEEMADVLDRMRKAADLHIVQGPPGTGKTSGLLSAYIEDFFLNSTKHMMVLSFTNRAVDEICLCLRKRGIPFIRTGSSQALETDTLDAAIQGKRFAEMEDLIRNNRIFVSTVQSANAYHRDLSRIIEIDEMIVDEASQILEPSLLGLLSGTKKCILIGDQNQLPAITTQNSNPYQFSHQSLRDLHYGSINQSLMERLFRCYDSHGWHSHKDMLKAHYRMHDEIAALVSHFYDGKLYSVRDSQKADLREMRGSSVMRGRLIWIECPVSTEDYYDSLQVEIVARIVAEYGEAKPDLGVVAPYRAMIHALRKKTPGISIDTVERYQGSERETMILCLPFRKLSSLKHMQSLSDDGRVDRKLNVALSRAKERLIIIGNSDLCRQAHHYQRLYESIRSRGQVINYQELGVNHGKPSTSESA
ncbi:MAG TPA: AAA domain-containing protein, partial [Candidatus Cloacimonadota bacterium]|nr:AAA domain-containing protein [Candidatus Cloacimonadota bacterium]